VKNYEKGDDVV